MARAHVKTKPSSFFVIRSNAADILFTMSNQQQSEEEQAALNAALDAALDDFDDEDETPAAAPSSSFGPPPPPPMPTGEDNDMDAMMQQMMQMMMNGGGSGGGDSQTPELAMMGQFLQHMQTQMEQEVRQMEKEDASKKNPPSTEKKDTTTTPAAGKSTSPSTNSTTKDSPQSTTTSTTTTASETKGSAPSPLDETIANLVESFAKNSMKDDDDDMIPDMNDTPQEAAFLEKLMQGNPDALLEGMMEELMSKELMQEPIKQVAAEFPLWIEKHKDSLTEQELKQYVLAAKRRC